MSQKPYHLMTPAERLAARIAQNREIEKRAAIVQAEQARLASVRADRQVRSAVKDLVRCLVENGDMETAMGVVEICTEHNVKL